MYTPEKLSQYLSIHDVTWANELPEGTPPEDIVVAYNSEPLYRLTHKKGEMTDEDMKTYVQLYPKRDFKDKLWQASGLSSYSTLQDARSMTKLPFLRHLQGIAEIVMQPEYGVMRNTPSNKNVNHYTWWHTSSFNIETAKINFDGITLNQELI